MRREVTARADAMLIVNDRPDIALAASADGSAVGMAHASWRGTVGGIARHLVEALTRELGVGAGDVIACIGPGAGPCGYEGGPDVRAQALGALGAEAEDCFRPRAPGKWLFDLWSANRRQLVGAGVRAQNVHVAGLCTICRSDLFPSYRVEGAAAGRFAGVIGRLGG